jgi:hypothetical protein
VLASTYTVLHYKPMISTSNEQNIGNILSRDFDDRNMNGVVVSY